MARGVIRLEWDQTSLLWATLAEPHRNTNERPEPFTPDDVHPLRATRAVEQDEGPDVGIWYRATKGANVATIDTSKLRN